MCSAANGCVRCADRLFLLLRRDGVSQRGTCLIACPVGYFGIRGRHVNRCMAIGRLRWNWTNGRFVPPRVSRGELRALLQSGLLHSVQSRFSALRRPLRGRLSRRKRGAPRPMYRPVFPDGAFPVEPMELLPPRRRPLRLQVGATEPDAGGPRPRSRGDGSQPRRLPGARRDPRVPDEEEVPGRRPEARRRWPASRKAALDAGRGQGAGHLLSLEKMDGRMAGFPLLADANCQVPGHGIQNTFWA
ncbi:R-spondin-4 isoform X2 [Stigmatopora argus]